MCAKQVSRSEGQKEVQKEWRRHMQRLDSEIVKQVYKASMFISIWKGCWRWKKERRGIYPNQKFQGRFPKGDDDWVRSGQLRMTHWKKKKKRMTHEHYQGWNRSPAQAGCMRRVLRAGALGRPRGMGWGGRREGGSGWGTHVNPWLIHVNVWKKPLKYCKVISLQIIKINAKKKKKRMTQVNGVRQRHLRDPGCPAKPPSLQSSGAHWLSGRLSPPSLCSGRPLWCRDAGDSKAPRALEAQKAVAQAPGDPTDRGSEGRKVPAAKKPRGSAGKTTPKLVLERHLMESRRKDSSL